MSKTHQWGAHPPGQNEWGINPGKTHVGVLSGEYSRGGVRKLVILSPVDLYVLNFRLKTYI